MKGFPDHATCSREIDSQVGKLMLFATAKGLAGLFFGHRVPDQACPPDDPDNCHLNAAEEQLADYFENRRLNFDIHFDRRGTQFQESVWQQLSTIPFGETRSYGDIAKGINNPNSVRAVGLANGSNPISIIVPCHRVIGADGSLTGFGGGLDIKHKLLTHEGLLLGLT
ncbi:methylated-DNA--[protein]-cysteine S-methyltransferase [Haloferula sp.]|uniref:methylated-DNA--[protein]-cysteine S-methyltransferase n=1 Tax=Haloferula sp. TaxID=2497595 RepID=UPI00329D5E55